MTCQSPAISDGVRNLLRPPHWRTTKRVDTPESVAFRSGAALAVLDQLVSDPKGPVPVKLLAGRLALLAATATSKLEGRMASTAEIRDAYLLTPPGAARGPDGELLAFWRGALRLSLNKTGPIMDRIGYGRPEDVSAWLEAGQARATTHGPLAGCSLALRHVLEADDRAERLACLLSDIVLARALDWKTVLPLSARRLSKGLLRNLIAEGQGGELALQVRILESIEVAIRQAQDLARRAEALRAVAPRLRAKGSDAAVALFLSEDAIAPASMLSPCIRGTSEPMTARAARRFCDRLVALGVARELTGRMTFRLYGIAP